MKTNYISLFVALLLMFSLNSYAQDVEHKGGIYGGIGFSTITGLDAAVKKYGLPDVNYSTGGFSSGYKVTWEIGFVYQYSKIDKYFIQTNMSIFHTDGAKVKGVSNANSINVGGARFNVFGGKKLKMKNDQYFIIGAGPSISINYASGYGGSADIVYHDTEYYDDYTGESYYETESSVVGGDSPRVNPLGLGVNAIMGIEGETWQVALVGNLGLTKVFKDSRYDSHIKSVSLCFVQLF